MQSLRVLEVTYPSQNGHIPKTNNEVKQRKIQAIQKDFHV